MLGIRTWTDLRVTIQPPRAPFRGRIRAGEALRGEKRSPFLALALSWSAGSWPAGAVCPSLVEVQRSGSGPSRDRSQDAVDVGQIREVGVRSLCVSHVCAEQRAWPVTLATVQATGPGEDRPARAVGHVHGVHLMPALTLWCSHPPPRSFPVWDAGSSGCWRARSPLAMPQWSRPLLAPGWALGSPGASPRAWGLCLGGR